MARFAAPPPPCVTDSLETAALKVLWTSDPFKKAEFGQIAADLWKGGRISAPFEDFLSSEEKFHSEEAKLDGRGNQEVRGTERKDGKRDWWRELPERPARDNTVSLVAPADAPKRGRGGSLKSRQAILHSLVHIESWAVDLAWDIIARFGRREKMPRAFFDDFVRVAEDEACHFRLLEERLRAIGSRYGAFPAHEGLWESAQQTSEDLRARLAIEHCVHEARGLDIMPQTIARFRAGGDKATANILEEVIYPEEITHCSAGVKWFTFLCGRELEARLGSEGGDSGSKDTVHGGEKVEGRECEEEEREVCCLTEGRCEGDVVGDAPNVETIGERLNNLSLGLCGRGECCSEKGDEGDGESVGAVDSELRDFTINEFHRIVRKHFRGLLKPPFNSTARAKAGFHEEWYIPLSVDNLSA